MENFDLEKIIRNRRSIRKFKTKGVPLDILYKLVNAAQWAPSACNRQAWGFIVVNDENVKLDIVNRAKTPSLFKDAPLIIFVIYDKRVNTERNANIQSAAAAIQNMLLVAHANGLGSLWAAAFGSEDVIKYILKIPDYYAIVAAVLIGFPEEKPPPPKRRNLDEIFHLNQFSNELYPPITDVERWTWRKKVDFSSKSIRTTSPPIGYNISFPFEFEKEIHEVVSKIDENKTLLNVYNFSGNHLFEIAKNMDNRIVSCELSDEISSWLKRRCRELNIKSGIDFVTSDKNLPFKSEKFDIILCLQKIDRLPDQEHILNEIYRVLSNNGKLILSFANLNSLYGFYISHVNKNSSLSHFGPINPLKPSNVRNMVNEAGLYIVDEIGIGLFPSYKTLNHALSSTFLKKCSPVFRLYGSKFEALTTRGLIKDFCRINIMECKKQEKYDR